MNMCRIVDTVTITELFLILLPLLNYTWNIYVSIVTHCTSEKGIRYIYCDDAALCALYLVHCALCYSVRQFLDQDIEKSLRRVCF